MLNEYGDSHLQRAITPVAAVAGIGLPARRSAPGQILRSLKIFRHLGRYIPSGQARSDPADVRFAHIRAQFAAALGAAEMDVPQGAFDPLLDFMASDLAEGSDEVSGSSEARSTAAAVSRNA